ncbi:glycosyltransferase family 2 protein [Planosporangium mesophilum]|nr:glycosyltransferase family A protein [Planosporangium mesophilum]NJC86544.1 glycosyltransferase family 2 protein [Planosporangium mesophilum]
MDPGDPDAFARRRDLDVLIPTRNRPVELTATLAGLAAQAAPFGIAVSDQSDGDPSWRHPAAAGLVRALRHAGHPVLLEQHLPRRGLAEQRGYLLSRSRARYVLFLDDDIWLEPGSVSRLMTAIQELGCGFVGNAPHGLSYDREHRPQQESSFEEWSGPVLPERLTVRGPQWNRHTVHNAANLLHITDRLGLRAGEWRAYKVAWIGACVLYDRAKLLAAGGYDFWPRVPAAHAGEDVVVQLRIQAAYGGAGIVPSGAYHLESPTTVPDRDVQCFDVIGVTPAVLDT